MSRNPVDLCGHNEIALSQAIDLVRVDRNLGFAPGEKNIRMVALLFGDCAGTVHEIKRFFEVRETKCPVQMVLVHDLPIGQLSFEFVQGVSFKRGNAAFARNAGLIG